MIEIFFYAIETLSQLLAFWIPLIFTLDTIFEVSIIYKKTIKGYYETQRFKYQGLKIVSTKEELDRFHETMHSVLRKNVTLHRFGLKRLHLCEFWCIYWMLNFFIYQHIIPVINKGGIPEITTKFLRILLPFTLYVFIHERPSHKNSDSKGPLRFPRLFSKIYITEILPLIKGVYSWINPEITKEKVHLTIKHMNGTIGASDFNMFGVESKPIFYFQSLFETKEPTTISIGSLYIDTPPMFFDSTRSSVISRELSPADSFNILQKDQSKPKFIGKQRLAARLSDFFHYKN